MGGIERGDNMAKNSSLNRAKRTKNDEFYTILEDIEKEFNKYLEINPNIFRGKTILLPCDDYEHSNFTNYFKNNFKRLGVVELISTCYSPTGKGKIEVVSENMTNRGTLNGNGDFRSEGVTKLKESADIVITNPPFSLLRDFIDWVNPRERKVCIIGNTNAIPSKEVFPYLRNSILTIGITHPTKFITPEGIIQQFGNICWFQNLVDIERPYIQLNKEFNAEDYLVYDNYAAVNVNRVRDIPKDYNGLMGVPITFLDKYNPKQFKLIGITHSADESPEMRVVKTSEKNRHNPKIKGKELYKRLIIKPLWVEEDAKGQVYKTLQKYSCEFTPNEDLCYIGYSNSARDLVVLDSDGTKGNHIYFVDEETLLKAVEEAGEANIKKYIFGVE